MVTVGRSRPALKIPCTRGLPFVWYTRGSPPERRIVSTARSAQRFMSGLWAGSLETDGTSMNDCSVDSYSARALSANETRRARSTSFGMDEPPPPILPFRVHPLTAGGHFHRFGNVELGGAVAALGALAQESRLALFRVLVQRGPRGLA